MDERAAKLAAAIEEFITSHEDFPDDGVVANYWLTTYIDRVERNGESTYYHHKPPGQPYHVSVGLLDVARDYLDDPEA